jgi:hypothetical protein
MGDVIPGAGDKLRSLSSLIPWEAYGGTYPSVID